MPYADLGDIKLHYSRRGQGPPVLGVMGFALDARYWAPQTPAVTAQNEFITFDNRGIGRSSGPLPTTLDEMANDAIRLLDELEIEKTIVFGVSMGGAISQRIVLDNPDRVSALILAVTWARPIEFMHRQHEVAKLLIQHAGTEALIEGTLVRMFTPEFFEMGSEMVDQMVKAFVADPDAMPSGDSLTAQIDAIEKHDTLGELSKITCPTLVLGGKMDQMVPYLGSKEIAATIPGAELVTFETGHGCMVEEMEPFNAKVTEFLRAQQA
jgi:3-oxoadipate enol-lactonase